MSRKLKTFILLFLSIIGLNVIVPPSTQIVYATATNDISIPENTFRDLSEEAMILVLTAIDEMPQDMGDQAEIDAYMLSKEIDLHFVNESQLRSFWGCVGAVTWAVGTTAVV